MSSSEERLAEEERALDQALTRLPRHSAPAHLVARLKKGAPKAPKKARAPLALFVGLVAVAATVSLFFITPDRVKSVGDSRFVDEAVNDHLRITIAEHPLDVESGGIHQVKPWFTGKVDFAPSAAFAGDDDYPLQGGALAYFLDRRAAAFVYKRRLHTITMLVFRADGIPFAENGAVAVGHVRATSTQSRGFHVVSWRDGDLGYAAVSDVDEAELLTFVRHAEP